MNIVYFSRKRLKKVRKNRHSRDLYLHQPIMKQLYLTPEQTKELYLEEKKQKNRNLKRRLRAIKLKYEWISNKDICKRLEISAYSLHIRTEKYRSGGIKALLITHYHKRRSSSLNHLIPSIKQRTQTKHHITAKDIQDFIQQKTGKRYDYSWIWKRSKKNEIIKK